MPIEKPHYIGNPNGLTFHEIPDSIVILRKGGIYKQSKIYIRGENLYAKHGSGYVQISRYGTSVPNLSVDGIDIPGVDFDFEKTGRMIAKNLKADEIKNIEHRD